MNKHRALGLSQCLGLEFNNASHGLYVLALAHPWRLQSYPITARTVLHAGLAELIAVNALELGELD